MTLDSIIKMYKEKEPIVMMTAYDYVSARACDSAGVDVVLVGDSLSMTFFGRPDTLSLTKEVSPRALSEFTALHLSSILFLP